MHVTTCANTHRHMEQSLLHSQRHTVVLQRYLSIFPTHTLRWIFLFTNGDETWNRDTTSTLLWSQSCCHSLSTQAPEHCCVHFDLVKMWGSGRATVCGWLSSSQMHPLSPEAACEYRKHPIAEHHRLEWPSFLCSLFITNPPSGFRGKGEIVGNDGRARGAQTHYLGNSFAYKSQNII